MTNQISGGSVPASIIRLYDTYTHGTMRRRSFLARLAALAGSAAAAGAFLPLLEGDAMARIVAGDDARLDIGDVQFPGASGSVTAYTARPAGVEKSPALIVIHQNKGLTGHIRDVARRFALEGFLAIAPDALSSLGGHPVPEDKDKGRDMIRSLDREKARGDFLAAVEYAAAHAHSNGRVGSLGFCWGGSMSGQLAVHSPTLGAAVVYYGGPPAPEDVGRIKVPLLLHYAGLDERLNKRLPAYEEALEAAGTDYALHIYPDVHHAFNDNTSEARYDAAAAALAWGRSVAFLKQNLSV